MTDAIDVVAADSVEQVSAAPALMSIKPSSIAASWANSRCTSIPICRTTPTTPFSLINEGEPLGRNDTYG